MTYRFPLLTRYARLAQQSCKQINANVSPMRVREN
jgi:hypothetical protein